MIVDCDRGGFRIGSRSRFATVDSCRLVVDVGARDGRKACAARTADGARAGVRTAAAGRGGLVAVRRHLHVDAMGGAMSTCTKLKPIQAPGHERNVIKAAMHLAPN